jgi:hypothetical protein
MPMIDLTDVHAPRQRVADAKRRAIELHQRTVGGQFRIAERLSTSLAAIERSREILAAGKQD